MNYYNTFIEVADDCPATLASAPEQKGDAVTMPALQYEMIATQPYTYTGADVAFETFADHKRIPAADRADEREKFFAKDQPCLRASALGKRYGWGIHFDANGKVALVAVETEEYQRLANDPKLKHLKAMRSKRA
jgi:hypothetical protein